MKFDSRSILLLVFTAVRRYFRANEAAAKAVVVLWALWSPDYWQNCQPRMVIVRKPVNCSDHGQNLQ